MAGTAGLGCVDLSGDILVRAIFRANHCFQIWVIRIGLGPIHFGFISFPYNGNIPGEYGSAFKKQSWIRMLCSSYRPNCTVLQCDTYGMDFFTNAYLPLYAFLWCTIGFSGIAMMCSKSLLPLFLPYLSNENGHICTPQKSEHNILEEMKKLEM